MPLSLHVPARFDPRYSLLGRLLRRRVGDVLRAEAFYVLAVAGVVLTLLLSQYLAWALLQAPLAAAGGEAAEQLLLAFWGAQVAAGVLVAAGCFLGFRPALRLRADAQTLTLAQGARTLRLSLAALAAAEPLDAGTYHRHYRRYAAVQPFLLRTDDTLLLLRADDGTVAVVGLPPADAEALRRHLARHAPTPADAARVA